MEGDARVTLGDRVQLLKQSSQIPDGVFSWFAGPGPSAPLQ